MFESPCAEWDREQSVLPLNRDGPCNSATAAVVHSLLIALLAWTAGAYALTPLHRPDSGFRNKEETGGSRDVMQWTAHPELSASPEGCGAGAGGVEGWSDVCAPPELAPASPHHTAIVRTVLVRGSLATQHNKLWLSDLSETLQEEIPPVIVRPWPDLLSQSLWARTGGQTCIGFLPRIVDPGLLRTAVPARRS